jgi:hypothetical protein
MSCNLVFHFLPENITSRFFMKELTIILLVLFNALTVFSQTTNNQMQYSKGKIIYQGERVLRASQIESIMRQKQAPQIQQFMKNYKSNSRVAGAFGFLGGLGIGYYAGATIGGKKPDSGFLAGSAGALLFAFLFDGIAKKNLKLAVNAYNNAPAAMEAPVSYR